jgi:HAD superfamily hydrolase (TIGR01509 family)
MDGVLTVNGHFHLQAWQRFARERLALDIAEDDPRIVGGRNEEILTAITGRAPDAETLFACDTEKEGHYRELARGNLRPAPGLLPYLDWLTERSLPFALVTSADTLNMTFVLEELGLAERFDIRVTAEDVRRGKPDPEPYLLAAARVGVDPKRCLVHEDAPSGIRSALAAGCSVVALTTTLAAPNLLAAGAGLCVPDFTAWMEQFGAS